MLGDNSEPVGTIDLKAALEAYIESVKNEPVPEEIVRLAGELNLLIESKQTK